MIRFDHDRLADLHRSQADTGYRRLPLGRTWSGNAMLGSPHSDADLCDCKCACSAWTWTGSLHTLPTLQAYPSFEKTAPRSASQETRQETG